MPILTIKVVDNIPQTHTVKNELLMAKTGFDGAYSSIGYGKVGFSDEDKKVRQVPNCDTHVPIDEILNPINTFSGVYAPPNVYDYGGRGQMETLGQGTEVRTMYQSEAAYTYDGAGGIITDNSRYPELLSEWFTHTGIDIANNTLPAFKMFALKSTQRTASLVSPYNYNVTRTISNATWVYIEDTAYMDSVVAVDGEWIHEPIPYYLKHRYLPSGRWLHIVGADVRVYPKNSNRPDISDHGYGGVYFILPYQSPGALKLLPEHHLQPIY